MKNKKNIFYVLVGMIFISASFISCQKDIQPASNGNNNLKVYLTDVPVNFDQVNINILAAEIKVETDSCTGTTHDVNDDHDSGGNGSDDNGNDDHGSGGHGSDDNGSDDNGSGGHSSDDSSSCERWIPLQINAGMYNILSFRNGVDALIATGSIPKGAVRAIRLTLGGNNNVVVDGTTYTLALKNNKVTIKLGDIEQLDLNNLKLNLDFDLANSIIEHNGQFELRPSIKPFNESKTGKVEGRVLPREAKTIVSLIGDKDTLVALPGDEGEFKIRGIRSTTFSLQFNATANGYQDTTITNLKLNGEGELKIGTISLHK